MTHKRRWLVVAGAALVCLPCLLPVIAALVGVAALSAAGGWLTGNAVAVGLAVAAPPAGLAAAFYVVAARRRRTQCSVKGPRVKSERLRGPD